jgi:hypothetical protein
MKIELDLTQKEIEWLRNSTSDIGRGMDEDMFHLKIANAILDAYNKNNVSEKPINDPKFIDQIKKDISNGGYCSLKEI